MIDLRRPNSKQGRNSESRPRYTPVIVNYRGVRTMTELLDLCYDVLIRVLEEIDPQDLAACAQTSVAFHDFLQKNSRLYKAHYLKTFVR